MNQSGVIIGYKVLIMAVKQKEMEEKFIMYQLLQKQLEMFREQAMQLEKGFIEIETTKQSVEDFQKLKTVNDIMIPLGSGYYIEGKITNLEKVLMSPGANIMLEKDLKSAHESLEDKKKEIEKIGKNLQDKMNEVVQKINNLAPELEKMVKS